jgi:hypothetical protein
MVERMNRENIFMKNMFIKTPEDGYWFKKAGIKKIEEKYGAKYMGYWCTKSPRGHWNESPVDVFYQPNPDTSKGHTHYFGMFIKTDPFSGESTPYITEASTAFVDPISGIPTDDGEVIVSRYRHDYVEKDGRMIDGGRDYTRGSGGKFVTVTVKDGEFVIKQSVERLLNDTGDYT